MQRTVDPSEHRRFLRQSGFTFALALLVIAGFNAVVDPYDVYRLPGPGAAAFDGHRPAMGSRITKLETIRRGPIDVLFVGSSRVEVGLDPAHPAFDGRRAYNAGMSGCWLEESLAVIDYALAHQPIEELILLLDFSYWETGRPPSQDFATARHAPNFNPVDYHGRLLLGSETIERSFETIEMRTQDEAGEVRGGLLVRSLKPDGVAQRHIFEVTMAERGLSERFTYNPSATDALAAVLQRARERGVRVTLVLTPTHAVRLVNFERRGLWGAFERWKRELVARVEQINAAESPGPAVALWDFSTFDPPNTEPIPAAGDTETVMRWYWDPGHFRPALGDRVLSRVTGTAADDATFGTQLAGESLGAHLSRERQRRAAYIAEHPNDAALVE
ncbi:MAG: hypothetical protein GVY24_04065 [Planctomycetes bacterium]|jgi:hypothetical protein|nr:hypothetical protein [Planctomycetota bacterium]